MRLTLRALSALLGYPSEELQANAAEIRQAIEGEKALPAPERAGLESLLRQLEAADLLDLQSAYCDLFDRSRSLSLHLFEHVHGDSRERGQAMIDLKEHYLAHGFFLTGGELPDFLPVFLEFASCLPPAGAREMLGQPVHVLAALGERLARRESPYGAIFAALVRLAGVRPEPETVAEMNERAQSEDARPLDEVWEEKPVTFTGADIQGVAHEMGGPTGVVARIRAANRPVGKPARS